MRTRFSSPLHLFMWNTKKEVGLGKRSVVGKPPPIHPPQKRTPFIPPPPAYYKKNKSFHSSAIHLNSLWDEDVITRQQHAAAWSSATCSALSSVKQIKGGICLYCASKSPWPLTTDTSHVDEEEDVWTEAPVALFPWGRRYANQTNRL